MLNRDHAPVGKTAASPGTIHFVDYWRVHVATAQEIGVQRMCDAIINRVLCRGQGMTDDLAAEYLRAADITAIAAKYIVLDALQL